MVQIPAGTAPNAVLQVRAPDGRTIKVRVPRNMRPGQQMRISVPAAAAPKATKPASEAQERDARRQRREEAARDREDAAARREAVERSRREAAEERERQREAAAARAEEVQCVICQETIRGGDQRLPCAHVFHRACLQRWLPEHRSCPVCRTPVSAESAPAPERGRADAARAEAERARAELRAARDAAARREAARARERDEAARREAARAREAAAERARRDEAARRERARAAFAVNQRVEVRCRGGDQWFTGKITAVHGGSWYNIIYDDGESEASVAVSRIRRWVSTPHTGAPASARPSADAARDEAARREAARARERDEAARREAARAREAAAERARAAFHVGQRVEVRPSTTSNQWFPAKITAVNGGRLYAILYDDGGISQGKPESLIRRPAAPAPPPPRLWCRVCSAATTRSTGSDGVVRCSRCGTWGAGAATTAQPGHSSPPSHIHLDAQSFAGDYFTCFPCFPLVPFACEKIIPHGWHDYQSKGWMVMLIPVPYPIPIPLCWDLHLVRLAGNTFAVDTPGCDKGTKQTWTSADGFQGSNRCCPTGRS